MIDMRRSTRSVHVWRIEHDAVNRLIPVWQIAAIRSSGKIGWQKLKDAFRNLPPKDSLAIGHIGHLASRRNV